MSSPTRSTPTRLVLASLVLPVFPFSPPTSLAQDLCTAFSGQWGYGRIFEVEVRDGLAYHTQGADVISRT